MGRWCRVKGGRTSIPTLLLDGCPAPREAGLSTASSPNKSALGKPTFHCRTATAALAVHTSTSLSSQTCLRTRRHPATQRFHRAPYGAKGKTLEGIQRTDGESQSKKGSIGICSSVTPRWDTSDIFCAPNASILNPPSYLSGKLMFVPWSLKNSIWTRLVLLEVLIRISWVW